MQQQRCGVHKKRATDLKVKLKLFHFFWSEHIQLTASVKKEMDLSDRQPDWDLFPQVGQRERLQDESVLQAVQAPSQASRRKESSRSPAGRMAEAKYEKKEDDSIEKAINDLNKNLPEEAKQRIRKVMERYAKKRQRQNEA